jgi:putative ABC transport system permease protein
VAVALALLGGLLAGGAAGLRAARLRPAEALRSVE